MKPLLIIMIGVVSGILSMPGIGQNSSALTQSDIDNVCQDKPIWLAFDIKPTDCASAALTCAKKDEFQQLDPQQLSEPFYHCVFARLGIDAS